MIEPITNLTTRADQAPQERGAAQQFVTVLAARLGAPGAGLDTADAPGLADNADDPRSDRARRDDPASLGGGVNLAALAMQELATRGTPRADVAAATEEMQTPSGKTPPGESAAGGKGLPDAHGPTAAATANSTNARPAASGGQTTAEVPVQAAPDAGLRAGDSPQPAPAAPVVEQGGPSAAPEPDAAAMGVAATPAAPSAPTSDSAAPAPIRAATGAGRASSAVSVFKAPVPPRQPGTAPEAFAAQLRRGLAAVLRQNGGSVTVRLAPQALGQVRIHLDMGDGMVSARFDVGGHEARRLLEADLGVLRQTLEARGLRVEDLHVGVRPELAGPRESPADPGGELDRDAPDPHASGGAGHGDPGAGARPGTPDSRPDAGFERENDPPTIDPWAIAFGGAAINTQGPLVLRLRLDAVA